MSTEPTKAEQDEGDPGPTLGGATEVKERISRIKSFIDQAAALTAREARRAEEFRQKLEETTAQLEEVLQQKDSLLKELEGSLTGRIHELEDQVRKKEELFAAQDAELNDLKGKNKEAEESAAGARQLDEIKGSLEMVIAALVSQVKQTREQLSQNSSTLKEWEDDLGGLEEGIITQIHDLESRMNRLEQK